MPLACLKYLHNNTEIKLEESLFRRSFLKPLQIKLSAKIYKTGLYNETLLLIFKIILRISRKMFLIHLENGSWFIMSWFPDTIQE